MVLASPRRDLIQACASHAAFLLDGRLEWQGTVASLCERFDARRLLVRTESPEGAAAALAAAYPAMRALAHPGEVWLCGEGPSEISGAARALEQAGIGFDRIEAAKPSLEMAFREVTA